MAAVLIVDEIASDREELARALEAEGFRVVQSESPAAAVRDIWEGSYIVVFIASVLSAANANELADQLGALLLVAGLQIKGKAMHHQFTDVARLSCGLGGVAEDFVGECGADKRQGLQLLDNGMRQRVRVAFLGKGDGCRKAQ